MLADGVMVLTALYSDNTAPSVVWVGFNRQAPVPFFLGDAFKSPTQPRTVEIYNTSASKTLSVTATVFDGTVHP